MNWLGTYNKLGYGAESVLEMRVVLADGAIGRRARHLSPSTDQGRTLTENFIILRLYMTFIHCLTSSLSADVSPTSTKLLWPTSGTIQHTEDNNLFFALRGAGSSYAVVTQFKYVIHQAPETLPAIILAWADTPADLEAIQVRSSSGG